MSSVSRGAAGAAAFTLVELLCVIAIIGILAALLLPGLSKVRQRALRAQCVSQLRQTGIAFHGFAHDHGSQFPMQVPIASGGTFELVQRSYRLTGDFYFSFRHFQALSNDLANPRVLACPSDTRAPASSFAELGNSQLSYFVGVNSEYGKPNSVLAGDRNVTNDWSATSTVQYFALGRFLRWTAELHQYKGDLLFADGRVEERNRPALTPDKNQSPPSVTIQLPSLGPDQGSPADSPAFPGGPVAGDAGTAGGGSGGGGASSPASARDSGVVGTVLAGLASPNANPPPANFTGQSVRPVVPSGTGDPLDPVAPKTNKAALQSPARASARINASAPPGEEPDVSPFGQWLATVMDDVVRKGLWLLYVLFAAVVVAALELRRRLAARKKKPRKVEP